MRQRPCPSRAIVFMAVHVFALVSTFSLGATLAVAGVTPAIDAAAAQDPAPPPPPPTTYPEIRKLYEAGKYQEVVDAVNAVAQTLADPAAAAQAAAEAAGEATPVAHPEPQLEYLAGQALEKLQQPALADERFARLVTDKPETDPWRFIGQSATLLNQTPMAVDESIAAARHATELAPDNVHAHYQLGLALAEKRDYAAAAPAFARATEIDPAHAYAHYYAGLSFYQVQRIDLVAKHFEAFLVLAPEAPERAQVGSIMRTIRG